MSHSDTIKRTIEIIHELNEGKVLTLNVLAENYKVSTRTIRRDFELIQEIFGEFIVKNKDTYRAYNKFLLEDILCETDLIKLSHIVNILDMHKETSVNFFKVQEVIKNLQKIYEFKTKPFDEIKDLASIKIIELAIKQNQRLKISYKIDKEYVNFIYQPYKILFLNENFYLIGKNEENEKVQFLRVPQIYTAEALKKKFIIDKEILNFIKKIQTPWAIYRRNDIKVTIKVKQSTAKYFILKKYLLSQKILQTFENGDIEVEYHVTDLKEISEFIVKWLPNITIIEPQELKESVTKILKEKLESIDIIEITSP